MKIFIYNESLKIEADIKEKEYLQEQIKCLDEQIKIRVTVFSSILRGILFEKENNNFNQEQLETIKLSGISLENKKSPVTQIKGDTEQEMKYKGITIFKNKKCKTYYARFRSNGKVIYISGKTQKECYEKLKKAKNSLEKENKLNYYTLQSWYKKWLELFKNGKVKQSTIFTYKNALKYVPEKILNKNIAEIKNIELQELIENVPYERQRQRVFDFLKDIFHKAYNYQVIKENPFNILEKPKHVKKKGTALNEEQQIMLINEALKNKEYFIFLVIMYQGLRKGEALGILKSDINFETSELTINKSLDYKNELGTTKNTYSNRVVPLFNNSVPLLKELIKTLADDERVFKHSKQKTHNDFKILLELAGLPKEIRLHDLRHTFITNCKNQNIPEHIIQTWVGHNIGSNITSSVYTHKTSDNKEVEILNKFYTNSTQKKERLKN